MIAIRNISPEDTPNDGENEYELRINSRVLCKFKHVRKINGLSECLRAAADAMDAQTEQTRANIESRLDRRMMESWVFGEVAEAVKK